MKTKDSIFRFFPIFLTLAVFQIGSAKAGELVVGSFNVEWLGHNNKVRDQSDIYTLARYVKSLEVDVLCLQEVSPTGDVTGNGQADWMDFLNALGEEFQGKVGETGVNQHLAIVWRTNRVDLSDFGELRTIQRETASGTSKKTFPRIPYTAYVKAKNGGMDFRLITVHLYFTDNKARYAEANRLKEWLNEYLETNKDKDVIIIGDFNTKSMDGLEFDPSESKTITNLESSDGFICISKTHKEYTTPMSEERYDHAFLSKDLVDEEYLPGTWDVRRETCETFPYPYLEHISNHCPVTLRLKDQDNDNDPPGDWGDDE